MWHFFGHWKVGIAQSWHNHTKERIFITWLGERPSFSPVIVNKKYLAPMAVYSQLRGFDDDRARSEVGDMELQSWLCCAERGTIFEICYLRWIFLLLKVDWVNMSATCTVNILNETCWYSRMHIEAGVSDTAGPPGNSGTPLGTTRRAGCPCRPRRAWDVAQELHGL